jgi:hypothetical protein
LVAATEKSRTSAPLIETEQALVLLTEIGRALVLTEIDRILALVQTEVSRVALVVPVQTEASRVALLVPVQTEASRVALVVPVQTEASRVALLVPVQKEVSRVVLLVPVQRVSQVAVVGRRGNEMRLRPPWFLVERSEFSGSFGSGQQS